MAAVEDKSSRELNSLAVGTGINVLTHSVFRMWLVSVYRLLNYFILAHLCDFRRICLRGLHENECIWMRFIHRSRHTFSIS